MGTNYYLRKNVCKECGRYDETHIGKASYGWKFLFDHNDWEYFEKNKESVIKFLKSGGIYDEYEKHIPFKKLMEVIEEHKKGLDIKNYNKENPKLEDSILCNFDMYIEDFRFANNSDFR